MFSTFNREEDAGLGRLRCRPGPEAEGGFLEGSCQTFCCFVEREVEQEHHTAVSSQTQGEADEEQRERGGGVKRGGGGGRVSGSALRSVICTDVAAALGQTLPVFCVHLSLVSPVLL